MRPVLDLYRPDDVVGFIDEPITEGDELGIVGGPVPGPFELLNVGERRAEHPAGYGDVRMAQTPLAIGQAVLAGIQH